MKYLEAIIVAFVWIYICAFAMAKGVEISQDMQTLTLAIVVAGTLAGGD